MMITNHITLFKKQNNLYKITPIVRSHNDNNNNTKPDDPIIEDLNISIESIVPCISYDFFVCCRKNDYTPYIKLDDGQREGGRLLPPKHSKRDELVWLGLVGYLVGRSFFLLNAIWWMIDYNG